jgi:hypothetical protein
MHALKDSNIFWGGAFACAVGLGFVVSALLKRGPTYCNPLNPYKGPISVRSIRLTYIPLGLVALFWGIRDLIRGF